MERVFSVDEISDHFWSPPPLPPPAIEDPKMNRSPSEWAFERFLEEEAAAASSHTSSSKSFAINQSDVVEVKDNHHHHHQPVPRHPNPLNQDQTYQSQKLNHAQANGIIQSAAAATASFSQGRSIPIDSNDYQAFLKSRLISACAAVALTRAPYVMPQSSAAPSDCTSQVSASSQPGSRPLSKGSPDKDVRGPIGIPALPAIQKKSISLSKPTGSGSSRDQSDDDDAEGEDEDETTENMDPTDTKRLRR
ncbi:hypothetical protein Dimus_037528 [Dionaea muscipula]